MSSESTAAAAPDSGENFYLHPAVGFARCVAWFPGWLRDVRGSVRATLREEKGLSARRRRILEQRVRDLDGMMQILEHCQAYAERFGASPVKGYRVSLEGRPEVEDLPGFRAAIASIEASDAREVAAATLRDVSEGEAGDLTHELIVRDGAVVAYRTLRDGKAFCLTPLGF